MLFSPRLFSLVAESLEKEQWAQTHVAHSETQDRCQRDGRRISDLLQPLIPGVAIRSMLHERNRTECDAVQFRVPYGVLVESSGNMRSIKTNNIASNTNRAKPG